jgi:dUTP pyrophosphatase
MIERGMRIAQMVIAPVIQCQITEIDSLDSTMRGTAGFGSTGT